MRHPDGTAQMLAQIRRHFRVPAVAAGGTPVDADGSAVQMEASAAERIGAAAEGEGARLFD
eukprot:5173640-Prymnesium_polylepis.1